MRRRRDVEPDNPFMRSATASAKPKKKIAPKPAPKPSSQAPTRIDAAAVRKQMVAQREIEVKEKESLEVKTPEPVEAIEIEKTDATPEIKETASERAVSAGSMLFGVEQISDENAKRLGDKVKENLLEKKNVEIKRPYRARGSKKGGGRQPKVSKFNRRKYLEYKVDVRNMLEEFSIEEEYRSNILGQVWAKGERNGVSDALEFINEKVEQGIIPEEMQKKLSSLMDKYSRRR